MYGKSHTLTDCCIEPNSPLNPKTEYGKSKLRAEIELQKVMDGSMLLSIIRPPSVYGYGCRGDLFKRYEKIAMLMPWIPKCEMSCLQGLLFIDNLCNVVHALIKGRREGTYHPQDRKLLSTSEILREIRIQKGKNCRVSRYLGKVISLCSFFSIYSKLFGAVSYSELFFQRELLECAMLTTHDGLRKMYRSEK